ncbi:ribose-5-phosphate isomerase RpiA [Candidatus Enterovibrio escicola]|uniref:Ribose-5-phosphate isomerase A n=1 Tax=Candidatus Enterovibrio escicola TaxID=1927127 RepID=A0A2A5T6G0_9GAMM|nr:ribose-5-phosphate isomerase RpiA [Candidatus Enterovibrio escacola]PCS23680.1 Ribose 5-phosphate isomerase A [Candidatus Enterovibrio escacola]
MIQNEMKKSAGWAALEYVTKGSIVGVGTGSTVNYFIDALDTMKDQIKGVVSSSVISSERLDKIGIPIFDSNEVAYLDIYVDSADEINASKYMIKGGGAALTGEKIVAAIAKKFICIIDDTKKVDVLGRFPIPVEVIPMARSYVGRELVNLGGDPCYRHGCITDNGNVILDVHNLKIIDAKVLENKINAIAGVVTVGLFANRGADVVLEGTQKGVLKS